MDERYIRHEGLFGAAGQERLGRCRVGIAGGGGLGSHVAQQLAYLGVPFLTLVDDDKVELRNLNRLVGATPADIGRLKVAALADMATTILFGADPLTVPYPLEHPEARAALAEVDVIFGCLDDDLARLHLIELSTAAAIPLFDLATDVILEPGAAPSFGGRLIFSGEGERCPYCVGELDQNEIRRATMTTLELDAEARVYGVPVSALTATTGPSVISLNGTIASLAVTEFMKFVTQLDRARADAALHRQHRHRAPRRRSTSGGFLSLLRELGTEALGSASRVTLAQAPVCDNKSRVGDAEQAAPGALGVEVGRLELAGRAGAISAREAVDRPLLARALGERHRVGKVTVAKPDQSPGLNPCAV
jgi:hypothetical protein